MDQNGNISLKLAANGPRRTDPTLAVALPYSKGQPLPVSIPYDAANPLPAALVSTGAQPLPVQINGIDRGRNWDPIKVDVEDAKVRSRPGGGER